MSRSPYTGVGPCRALALFLILVLGSVGAAQAQDPVFAPAGFGSTTVAQPVAPSGGYAPQGYVPQGYGQQGYQGYYQQQGQQSQQQGYYQQQGQPYGQPAYGDPAGKARLGRTLGGAAGIAAGSFGGALIASAVIKSAGIAALGPLAPLLVGTAITAGGAFLGAKGLSMLGQGIDRTLGPDAMWTTLGGVAGAIAGFTLLPALGPFAGPMGRVLGAALGGFAGGMLAKFLAPTLDKVATPGTIYGATGAVLGGVGFGPIGAIAGAAGGYALGSIFDKNFFVAKNGSLQSTVRDFRDDVYDLNERFRNYGDTVGDWVNNRTDRFGQRMQTGWNYYDRDSAYYQNYADSHQYMTANSGPVAVSGGYGLGYENYSAATGFTGSLAEARKAYYASLEYFNQVNASGTPDQRYEAVRRVHETQVNLRKAMHEAGGY